MKIRLLLALVGWAISFAVPTFARQTNTPDAPTAPSGLSLALKKAWRCIRQRRWRRRGRASNTEERLW